MFCLWDLEYKLSEVEALRDTANGIVRIKWQPEKWIVCSSFIEPMKKVTIAHIAQLKESPYVGRQI
jgi:hypothetical protein